MKAYPAYRDSGVVWFGPIPQHWDTGQLKFRLSSNDGGVWGDDFADDGTIVLRSTEINLDGSWNLEAPAIRTLNEDEIAKTRLLAGDLLITKSSGSEKHIGKTALVRKEVEKLGACYSNFTQRVRPTNDLESRFLHFFLNSSLAREQYNYHSTTTTGLANLNAEIIGNLRVPFAPLPEQQNIADFLDRKTAQIDTFIEKNQRQIELLQEHRSALINQAVTKGLNPDALMKDSGIEWLGEVPEHWDVYKLKWIVKGNLMYGANESSSYINRDSPRYIRITDFDDRGLLREDTFRSLPYEKAKDYLLDDGDILFARSGATVGKTFQFRCYEGLACFAGYLIKAVPNKEIILSDFLYLFTKSQTYDIWKNQIFIQATIQNISANKYQLLDITIPPISEQHEIIQYLAEKLSKIDILLEKTSSQIAHYEEYRTALISAAVIGKIDVRQEKM